MKSHVDIKIQAHHLKRRALIYVRQSSMRQVLENTESTARQYALADRAQELGWTKDLIDVIDEDLGKSASSARHRSGFQRLVADVALGQVGIVMGLEMSRLARNNADFQQLLQICGTNNTLIYDADAVYDLTRLNDRLVLGLKGTMSEAELFTIRARLQGGALNKAARGELKTKLPIGFIYTPGGKVVLDPDRQIQETIHLFFKAFRKVGSARGIVRYFDKEGHKFPVRPVKGPQKGELTWQPLSSGLAMRILHCPRYAGAFSYGRTRLKKSPSGGASYSKRDRDQWHALVKDVHPGYIDWGEFEDIQRRLTANCSRDDRGPAREGRALLQGIAICGKCGRNLAANYKGKDSGKAKPIYICNRDQLNFGKGLCTYIPGSGIDEIITELLLEKVTPVAVDAAAAIQREIMHRAAEADKLLHRHVERAQYEAELTKRRLLSVDPENRLVAQTFETEWNEKLILLEQAKREYERSRKDNGQIINAAKHEKTRETIGNFAMIWSHESTTWRERKRIVRLLIDDVTIKREGYMVGLYIRFKGGAIVEKSLRVPRSGNKQTEITPELVTKIDGLADRHTAGEIAVKLNESGFVHPTLGRFNTNAIVHLCHRFKISTCYERLRYKGYLSQEEVIERCGITPPTVQRWRRLGWIDGQRYNDKPEYLYKPDLSTLPPNLARQYESCFSTI